MPHQTADGDAASWFTPTFDHPHLQSASDWPCAPGIHLRRPTLCERKVAATALLGMLMPPLREHLLQALA